MISRHKTIARLLTLSLTAALLHEPAAAHERYFADLVAEVNPSIVGVGTYLATRRPPARLLGTGFAVLDGRYVATNDHVVPQELDDGHRERLVVFIGRGRDTQLRDAEVRGTDPEHDLAILRIDGEPLPAMSVVTDDSAREGDEIAFTGFPIGAVLGLYPVTHRGIVSAITPLATPARHSRELTAKQVIALRNPYKVLQLDATAYPGNSGSPVYLRDSGVVIGVIDRVMVKARKENILSDPSAITYAVPARYLRELLERVSR